MSDYERARQELADIKKAAQENARKAEEEARRIAKEDKEIRQERIKFLKKELPPLMEAVNDKVLGGKGNITPLHEIKEINIWADNSDVPSVEYWGLKSLVAYLRIPNVGISRVGFCIAKTPLESTVWKFMKYRRGTEQLLVPDSVLIDSFPWEHRKSKHSFAGPFMGGIANHWYMSCTSSHPKGPYCEVRLGGMPEEIVDRVRGALLTTIVGLHRRNPKLES